MLSHFSVVYRKDKDFRSSCLHTLLKFATTFSGLQPPKINSLIFIGFNPEKVGLLCTTNDSWFAHPKIPFFFGTNIWSFMVQILSFFFYQNFAVVGLKTLVWLAPKLCFCLAKNFVFIIPNSWLFLEPNLSFFLQQFGFFWLRIVVSFEAHFFFFNTSN